MKKTRREALKQGVERGLSGVLEAIRMYLCIQIISWIVPRLINFLATAPVQLRDPLSTAILVCKVVTVLLAALVGLGSAD